jgi:hypothetical protein
MKEEFCASDGAALRAGQLKTQEAMLMSDEFLLLLLVVMYLSCGNMIAK